MDERPDVTGRRWGLPLSQIDPALRTLFTGYLVVIGIGLLMSFVQILFTHGMADGRFGLSVTDIVYSYYGNREGSRLEAKLQGSIKLMASTHDRAGDHQVGARGLAAGRVGFPYS